MAEKTVISMTDVFFSFDGVGVLEAVTFAIAERELISLIGPNGGGKTTLLKLILGLLKPVRGSVEVFGGTPVAARRRIGYMPQYAHHDPQFPITVMDVVLTGRLERRLGGPYSKADKAAAAAALDELGLAGFGGRLFHDLSGGQRQRVLLARALACEPELLILDEPTANVDVLMEMQFYELLESLNERMTVLLVSHDLTLVSKIVDRVLCVSRCVKVHPTGQIDARVINEMYGTEFCMIRHDTHIDGGVGGVGEGRGTSDG